MSAAESPAAHVPAPIEDVLLPLPFLFVPFLTPRDCLALASTSTVSRARPRPNCVVACPFASGASPTLRTAPETGPGPVPPPCPPPLPPRTDRHAPPRALRGLAASHPAARARDPDTAGEACTPCLWLWHAWPCVRAANRPIHISSHTHSSAPTEAEDAPCCRWSGTCLPRASWPPR